MIVSTLKKCYLAFFTLIFLQGSHYALTKHEHAIDEQNELLSNNTKQASSVSDNSFMNDCNETAFAFLNTDDDPLAVDNQSTCFIPQFNRWGWTTFLDFSEDTGQSSYTLDIYAGAGQCDLSKGSDVGSVTVTYNEDSTITFNYSLEGFLLSEAHIYVGTEPYPTNNSGAETVAPGQYTFTDSDFGEVADYTATLPVEGTGFYIIVHGVTQAEDCPDGECEDSDADGICDSDDVCPGFDDTIDLDGNGIPDGCDCEDSDADGVCDTDDVCPGFDDSIDSDGDGIPDGCDCEDSDGDGVCDTDDVCPGYDDTIDSDGDGIPDGCDNVAYAPQLFDAYPVPFKNKLNVRYTFDYETYVNVEVYDLKGTKLFEFENKNYVAGTVGQTKLDLSHASGQLLFVRLTTVKNQFAKKIVSSSTKPIKN
ncbi:MAG: T9SS type A sorting domain-containing protein [Flavobacteriaceae bacterium]|nr:MAG: T9SS type A sorting domain-containing protein [Flavobacteriaceae bacterium]